MSYSIPISEILTVIEKNYKFNERVYSEKYPTINDFVRALLPNYIMQES